MSALSQEMRGLDNVPLRSNTGIPSGRLAVWLLLSGEIVIFGGLVTAYMLQRLSNLDWAESAHHTNTYIGAFNAVVLLTSDLFVVMAHAAAQKKDKDNAVKFINLTILLGLLFLAVKTFEYSSEISHGLTPVAGVFWTYYYLITGIHASHIVAGVLALFFVSLNVKKGQHFQRVEYAGIYWHFVDMVWLIVFPLLYIAK